METDCVILQKGEHVYTQSRGRLIAWCSSAKTEPFLKCIYVVCKWVWGFNVRLLGYRCGAPRSHLLALKLPLVAFSVKFRCILGFSVLGLINTLFFKVYIILSIYIHCAIFMIQVSIVAALVFFF